MNDNELRARLGRLDPQATTSLDPITSPRAQHLLGTTMTATETSTPTSTRLRRGLVAAAGAAAVAITVGVLVTQNGDSTIAPAKQTTLALALPDPSSSASCIPFDVAILKGFPVAFAGLATSVAGDTVTLEVTKWYAGGTAQLVTLSIPGANTSAALDSASFARGKSYLVSANEGTVTSCGYSGESSEMLQQAYAQAFGG